MSGGVRVSRAETETVALGLNYAIDHWEHVAAIFFNKPDEVGQRIFRGALVNMRHAYNVRQRILPASYKRVKS